MHTGTGQEIPAFCRFQTSRLFIPAEAGDAAAVLIGSQQHIG